MKKEERKKLFMDSGQFLMDEALYDSLTKESRISLGQLIYYALARMSVTERQFNNIEPKTHLEQKLCTSIVLPDNFAYIYGKIESEDSCVDFAESNSIQFNISKPCSFVDRGWIFERLDNIIEEIEGYAIVCKFNDNQVTENISELPHMTQLLINMRKKYNAEY